MATVFRPVDISGIPDVRMRSFADEVQRCLRDWGAQFNTSPTSASNPTSGKVVNTIQANSGTKFSGAISFKNTSTVLVNAAVNNFTWTVDTAGLVSIIGDVPTNTYGTPAEGSAATVVRTDAVLPFPPTAAPTSTYGTTGVDGVANTLVRTDARLPYADSLMATGTTKLVTLSDDATEGALFTSGATFSANGLALKAPNATNTLRVGKYGNISMAGVALDDRKLCVFSKTDYNETIDSPAAQICSITNTNLGTSAGAVRGIAITASSTMLNAAGASTNPVLGMIVTLSGGNTSNNNFTAPMIGYRFNSMTATAQTVGTAIASITAFEAGSSASPYALTRVAVTDIWGFRARGGASLLTSASVTNFTGFRCEAITQGTNRYGLDIAAFTTGTPTVSYGVQVGTHSVGTTRRSVIGGNSFHCTANDFLCDTAAKGLVVKDTQGTPEYWRFTADTTGTKDATMTIDSLGFASFTRAASATGTVTFKIVDVGTSLPTT